MASTIWEIERMTTLHGACEQLEITTSELLGQMHAAYALGLNTLADRLNVEVERLSRAGQELYKCWNEELFDDAMTRGSTATKLPTTVFCIQQRMKHPSTDELIAGELIAVRRTFVEAMTLISGREGTTPVPWQEHDSHGMTPSKKPGRTRQPVKITERRRVNGFLVYEDGEKCDGCGVVQHQTKEDKANGDPAGYVLTCPECYRPGCEECMPAGRGCKCPECEEKE